MNCIKLKLNAGTSGEIERCNQNQAGLASVWFHFGTTVWRKLCSCLLIRYYYSKLFHSESVHCLQWNLFCNLASISAQSEKKEVGCVKPWPNRLASWKLASTCDSVWPGLACTCVDLRWLALILVEIKFARKSRQVFHRLATQPKSTQVG